MGCDIHAYIETVHKRDHGDFPWLWAKLHMDRNYALFALMAGVRWHPSWESTMPESSTYKPKGVPDNLSTDVYDEYYLRIDDAKAESGDDYYTERYITRAQAEKYATYGDKIIDYPPRESDGWQRPSVIADPDWHSASWLSLEELIDVKRKYRGVLTDDEVMTRKVGEGETLEGELARAVKLRRNTPKKYRRPLPKIEIIDVAEETTRAMQAMVPGSRVYTLDDIRPEARGDRYFRFTWPGGKKLQASKDLDAIIAAMRGLRSRGQEPRLVFWFDN